MGAERWLVYSASLPFLLLTLRILPSYSPSGGGRSGGQTLAPPAAKYVVRFVEYSPADDHREYLETGLRVAALPRPAASWRWLERRNPAAAFSTDFAVLEIRDAHRAAVIAAIRVLGRVRDVHADASYSRGVLSTDRPPRRGKLFTSMPFEGEEEGGGDKAVVCSRRNNSSSASWRRKLLMQRSQVTSLFGAERLWGKKRLHWWERQNGHFRH